MAFKVASSDSEWFDVKTNTDIYLFPYGWFLYGLSMKYIVISRPVVFHHSIQGSMIESIRDAWQVETLGPQELFDTFGDFWAFIKSGDDVINLVIPPPDCPPILTRSKIGVVEPHTLEDFVNASLDDQERWNRQYITCFSGCGVTLKERKAWFVSADQLRLM